LKKAILILNYLLIVFIGNAQSYTYVNAVKINANSIEVDEFNNIYAIEDFKISKFNAEGKLLFEFNNTNNGVISHFDVTNPLKPVVFYRDFQILVMLDHKLTIIHTVKLLEYGFDNIQTICAASNNSYWIYDNSDHKLKKIDVFFEVVQKSDSYFNTFKIKDHLNLFLENKEPLILKENANKLYSLDIEGLKVFDLYGNYINTINMFTDDFQIVKNQIVYYLNNSIYLYNNKKLEFSKMEISSMEGILSAKLIKDKIVYRLKEHIIIYSID